MVYLIERLLNFRYEYLYKFGKLEGGLHGGISLFDFVSSYSLRCMYYGLFSTKSLTIV